MLAEVPPEPIVEGRPVLPEQPIPPAIAVPIDYLNIAQTIQQMALAEIWVGKRVISFFLPDEDKDEFNQKVNVIETFFEGEPVQAYKEAKSFIEQQKQEEEQIIHAEKMSEEIARQSYEKQLLENAGIQGGVLPAVNAPEAIPTTDDDVIEKLFTEFMASVASE